MQEQLHEQERFASIDAGILNQIEAPNSKDTKEHQIKLYLKDKTVLPKGYQWEEKGREFSHEGMFYDIVALTKTEAGWELVAAADKEEADIVAKQTKAHHLDKEIAGNKKTHKSKLSFNFSIYESVSEQPSCQLCLSLNLQAFAFYIDPLSQQVLGRISPPPEAV